MPHTVSFIVIDYSKIFRRADIEVEDLTNLESVIPELIGGSLDSHLDDELAQLVGRKNIIAKELREEGYYVENIVNKYYALGFAIDFHRFQMRARDFEPRLVKWRDNDENDPVVYQLEDEAINAAVSAIFQYYPNFISDRMKTDLIQIIENWNN